MLPVPDFIIHYTTLLVLDFTLHLTLLQNCYSIMYKSRSQCAV